MSDKVAENIALVKSAWSQADVRIRDRQVADSHAMIDALADDAVFQVACPPDTPIFGPGFHGKEAIARYFTSENRTFQTDAWLERPMEFLANEDKVVALLAESYVLSDPAVTIRDKEVAIVHEIRDGKITRITLITDMSEFVDAFRRRTEVAAAD